MSLLGVPSQWALDKGIIEVLEGVSAKVTRVPVNAATIILVLNMPKEHGQQIMFECLLQGKHGWISEAAWIPRSQPAFYRLKRNIQLNPVGPRTYLLRNQVVLLLSIPKDTDFEFPVALIYLQTGVKAICPLHLLQVQVPTVFTALTAQPKFNMLRLRTSTMRKGAKVTTLAATTSDISAVVPGDVLVSTIIPTEGADVSYIWVIERPAGPKAQAYASQQALEDALETYDSIAKRDAVIDSHSERETSDAVYSYVYQLAMYGRGHAPLIASSRITLTDLAAPILQQPDAALRLRTSPNRPARKLPYREVFWPFKVDDNENEKETAAGSDEDIRNEEILGEGNVCGLWDRTIGPLHTVRVAATRRTRSSEDSDDSDSGGDDDSKAARLRSTISPPSRASFTSAASRKASSTTINISDSERSQSQMSQNSSPGSYERKPLWLQIVTDGQQGQFCMKKYTQTISLTPLQLSLDMPAKSPMIAPTEEAQEDDMVLAYVLESEVESPPGVLSTTSISAPVQTSPIVPSLTLPYPAPPSKQDLQSELDGQESEVMPEPAPTPVLKTKPAISELHTPDSQSIRSFVMEATEREGGGKSPSSSLSSGSEGGSHEYYTTSKTAWDINAKDEEKDYGDDDLSQFLSRSRKAYPVARLRSISELRATRDTGSDKALSSRRMSVSLGAFLMALIVVLIAFVAIGIALLLTVSKPPIYDAKWFKVRTTS